MPGTKSIAEITARLGKGFLTIRWIMFAANLLLFVMGIVLLGVGVATKASDQIASLLSIPGLDTLSIGLIVLGVLIIVLSLFGVSGILAHSRVLLVIFVVILSILVICETSVGIAAAVNIGKLPKLLDIAWDNSDDYDRMNIQNDYQCCGFWNNTDRIADPCPVVHNATVTRGCEAPLYNNISGSMDEVAITGIIVAAIEVVGILLTIALVAKIGRVHKHVRLEQTDLDRVDMANA